MAVVEIFKQESTYGVCKKSHRGVEVVVWREDESGVWSDRACHAFI